VPCYQIRLDDDEQGFPCSSEQNILAALAPVHNARIAAGCHGGGCGICRIVIREGAYSCRAMSRAHVTADDQACRIALACRTFPRSDLRIEPCSEWTRRLARRGVPSGMNPSGAMPTTGNGEVK